MANNIRKVIAWGTGFIILVGGLALYVSGCNNNPNPEDEPGKPVEPIEPVEPVTPKKPCACPNGTLHLVGENCCEDMDNVEGCTCETSVVGTRVNGIPVTSRGGNHTAATANVTTAFSWLTPAEQAAVQGNVREIKVITSSNREATFSKREDGKYVIEIGELSIDESIYYALFDIAEEVSTLSQIKFVLPNGMAISMDNYFSNPGSFFGGFGEKQATL